MDTAMLSQLDRIEKKVDATYRSAEKTRKYFLATLIITVIFFILPLVIMAVILPALIDQLSSLYSMY